MESSCWYGSCKNRARSGRDLDSSRHNRARLFSGLQLPSTAYSLMASCVRFLLPGQVQDATSESYQTFHLSHSGLVLAGIRLAFFTWCVMRLNLLSLTAPSHRLRLRRLVSIVVVHRHCQRKMRNPFLSLRRLKQISLRVAALHDHSRRYSRTLKSQGRVLRKQQIFLRNSRYFRLSRLVEMAPAALVPRRNFTY